jgi:DNA-binding IclR family transcriptional regulator
MMLIRLFSQSFLSYSLVIMNFSEIYVHIMDAMTSLINSPPARTPTSGAQTLRRGLSVLRLLARMGDAGLKAGEIARKLDLNRITSLRLTRTLEEEGFVVQDEATGSYRLGPEAFAVGLAAEPGYELQRLAAPMLRTLALETGDTVFFTLLHEGETICLSRDEGGFPIRNQLVKPGDRWPLGVGAGSCAILAAHADENIKEILAKTRLFRSKKYPRCSDEAIRQLIGETREKGYCLHPGLVAHEQWAVGVAVLDADQRPTASISVAAISSRLGVARAAALANRLMQCSRDLSLLMGSRG